MRELRRSDVILILALVALACLAVVWPVQASAGCYDGRCHPGGRVVVRYHYRERGVIRYAPAPVAAVVAAPVYATPQAQAPMMPMMAPAKVTPTPQASTGFVGELNALRARYGLPGVGEDANLAAWANFNNGYQSARGMGHFVMGPARRQNVAWTPNGVSPLALWQTSPPHRAALLDPTIRVIGIATLGVYWTFNAR